MADLTHLADKDAPKRGHLLTITKHEDWTEDEPYWDWSITCQSVDLCNGWLECRESHEIDGTSAEDGPYECDESAAWCDEDVFMFHGVEHNWRYGHGWTVPYEGCVVQSADSLSDDVHDIGLEYGEGTYAVEDDWDDEWCWLTVVTRVLPPGNDQGARDE